MNPVFVYEKGVFAANGLIVEGANIPTTEEADKIIQKKGIHVVPDFIANQGSICYFTSI